MFEYVVVVIGFVAVINSLYATIKIANFFRKKEEILDETINFLLDKAMNDAETQKKIYLLGALLGNGIRQGVGIGKTGGKFSWENLIGQVLSTYFNKGQQPTEGENPFATTS